MATVFLSLGSNMGDRRMNLKRALRRFPPHAIVEKISAIYETRPHGVGPQPLFYNIAVQAQTKLLPLQLLRRLKLVETELGREGGHNLPRPIDIDILIFDDVVHQSPELTIPHPRLHERAFVLVPLVEIAPLLPHPGRKNKVIADLHADIIDEHHTVWPAPEKL